MLDDKETHEVKLFLDKVHFALEFTSRLTRELDQEQAIHFNIFQYLRDNELGLSRIIADLLDPMAQHGQGVLFLREFLKLACDGRGWNELESKSIEVINEYTIPNYRRIDIWVRIGGGGESNDFCLAFENKPYAGDGEEQLLDYLKFLRAEFEDNFLLIYLAPANQRPAELSLPRSEYNNWKNHLIFMAYTQLDENSNEEDGNDIDAEYYQEFLCNKSLTDWLKSSRKLCDSDRLRRFLNDFENYCYERFGNNRYDNVEVRIMENLIKNNPELVKSAYLIHQCWPGVMEMIGKNFLNLLHTKIEDEAFARRDDVLLEKNFDTKANNCYIRLCKNSWPSRDQPIFYVYLINEGSNFKWWYVGVGSDISTKEMNDEERKQRDLFKNELNLRIGRNKVDSQWCPGWKYIDNDKWDWQIVADRLISEVNAKGGDLTNHYLNLFVEYAEVAVNY